MIGRKDVWVALSTLYKRKIINVQAYKTYKGQILSGNEDACIKGLLRKGLITEVEGKGWQIKNYH